MSNQSNAGPTSTLGFNEEWKFINMESSFLRHLIGSGVTSLGRADHSGKGRSEYFRAFLQLSVGLERLAKLILAADYALTHQGSMPNGKYLKDFGHEIKMLLDTVEQIEKTQCLQNGYARPVDALSIAIIDNLDAFADAKRGRYANFSCMNDPAAYQHEPIRKWWAEVSEEILNNHYYGKEIEQRVTENATEIHRIQSPALVNYTDESGNPMTDIFSSSVHTGKTEVVQKWSRFYVLFIIRWLADIYRKISVKAAYGDQPGFFGSEEFFACYTLADRELKSYKVWPQPSNI